MKKKLKDYTGIVCCILFAFGYICFIYFIFFNQSFFFGVIIGSVLIVIPCIIVIKTEINNNRALDRLLDDIDLLYVYYKSKQRHEERLREKQMKDFLEMVAKWDDEDKKT